MTDDFTLVDFALVGAPLGRVVQALGQVHAMRRRAGGGAATGTAAARPGLFARIVSRRPDFGADGLFWHPERPRTSMPLARLLPDDLGFSAGDTPFRVSGPIGHEGLTLIEFLEVDGETSPVCETLSAELPGSEVFRFRLSGDRHPGAETAFHIYRDGKAIRRTASLSAHGTTPEADWRMVESGLPHPVEADSLPHARARAWEIMTPERQGAILLSMGVDPDRLFDAPDETPAERRAEPAPDDAAARVSVYLSAEAGGRPLHDVWTLLDPQGHPRRPRPAAHAVSSAGEASESVSPGGDAEAAPAAAHPPSPDAAPPAPGLPLDEDWDAEVTGLLIRAVTDALPEEEHLPWLTRLTDRLEAGHVDAALAEARALFARGGRPEAERLSDIARLDRLFGVTGAGSPRSD